MSPGDTRDLERHLQLLGLSGLFCIGIVLAFTLTNVRNRGWLMTFFVIRLVIQLGVSAQTFLLRDRAPDVRGYAESLGRATSRACGSEPAIALWRTGSPTRSAP